MTKEIVPVPSHRSAGQILRRIRRLAKDTGNITWTMHALDRMDERAITSRQALETVRRGEIVAGPETDEYGDAKVTLKRRYAGQLVRVVVAISERDELTIITAM